MPIEDWSCLYFSKDTKEISNFQIKFEISFEKNYYKCDQLYELRELINDKISL